MNENAELVEISSEEITEIMEKGESLGSPADMEIGQKLLIPVAEDDEGAYVFYGPLDFTGSSNDLSDAEWKAFVQKVTGFEPVGKMIVEKTSEKDAMYIFAKSDCSIGPCNVITPFNNIYDFLKEVFSWGIVDTEDVEEDVVAAYKARDVEKLVSICGDLFQHSFFTGLMFGPYKYIGGDFRATARGYAKKA